MKNRFIVFTENDITQELIRVLTHINTIISPIYCKIRFLKNARHHLLIANLCIYKTGLPLF